MRGGLAASKSREKRSGTDAHRTRVLHHHFSSKVSHLSGISASALPRPARKARTRFRHHGPFEILLANSTSPNMICHGQSDKWTAADCKAFRGCGQLLVSGVLVEVVATSIPRRTCPQSLSQDFRSTSGRIHPD